MHWHEKQPLLKISFLELPEEAYMKFLSGEKSKMKGSVNTIKQIQEMNVSGEMPSFVHRNIFQKGTDEFPFSPKIYRENIFCENLIKDSINLVQNGPHYYLVYLERKENNLVKLKVIFVDLHYRILKEVKFSKLFILSNRNCSSSRTQYEFICYEHKFFPKGNTVNRKA